MAPGSLRCAGSWQLAAPAAGGVSEMAEGKAGLVLPGDSDGKRRGSPWAGCAGCPPCRSLPSLWGPSQG